MARNQSEEAAFQASLIDIAKMFGWKVHHSRKVLVQEHGQTRWKTPVAGHEGFVDLTLARNGVVIHAELKTETGKSSPEQLEWADAIGATHVLWRPHQYQEIVTLLSDGRMNSGPWRWIPSSSRLLKKKKKPL